MFDARLGEHPVHRAALLLEQRGQHMNRLDELMIAPDGQGLRVGERLLEVGRQFVHPHSGTLLSFGWRPDMRVAPGDLNRHLGNYVRTASARSSQISVAMRPQGASRRWEKNRSASPNVQNPPPRTRPTPAAASSVARERRRDRPANGRADCAETSAAPPGSVVVNASRTSSPTSYAAAPIAGPSHAESRPDRRRPPQPRRAARRRRARASPRAQPRCGRRPRCRSATGKQSAVSTAQTTPGRPVTAPSASPRARQRRDRARGARAPA